MVNGVVSQVGVAASDNVRVSEGQVPVTNVFQKRAIRRRAAGTKVPAAKVQKIRHFEKTEPPQMMRQVGRQQRGQERGALLGHPPLREAQHFARDLVIDHRAREQIDQGAERQPEQFQRARDEVTFQAAIDQDFPGFVVERRQRREAPA